MAKNSRVKNSNTELRNYSKDYKNYNLERSINKSLNVVPAEDLVGIDKINIYDSALQSEQSGKYHPPNLTGKGAEIDLYLHQTLGYMTLIQRRNNIFDKIRNEIFLISFGRLFIAGTLFHEIGHHKYATIVSKHYSASVEQEEGANNYANTLLLKNFPIIKYYGLVNALYNLLFWRRIRKSNKFISKKPIFDFQYFFIKGKMFLEQNRYEKAVAEFTRVLQLNPTYQYAYFNRGVAKLNLGKFKDAIEDFTLGINTKSEDPMSYYDRGYCYYSIHELEKAIEDYTHAIELDYPFVDVYLSRALCYKELREFEKAKHDIQDAMKRGINESAIPSDLLKML